MITFLAIVMIVGYALFGMFLFWLGWLIVSFMSNKNKESKLKTMKLEKELKGMDAPFSDMVATRSGRRLSRFFGEEEN